MAIKYKCPNCGSTELEVDCDVYMKLVQTEKSSPFLEPLDEPRYMWDLNSIMECQWEGCGHWGAAEDFQIDEESDV